MGYNVPNDNSAVGFCSDAIPEGTMRSILDYAGDGSTAGSFAKFPCDSSPSPNASFPSIVSCILSPDPTLNPTYLPLASPSASQLAAGKYVWSNASSTTPVVATMVKPWLETQYTWPESNSETVAFIHSLSNGIPVTITAALGVGPTGNEGGEEYVPSLEVVVTQVMYLTTVESHVVVATITSAGGSNIGVIIESSMTAKKTTVRDIVIPIGAGTGTGGTLMKPSQSIIVFTGSAVRFGLVAKMAAMAAGLVSLSLL